MRALKALSGPHAGVPTAASRPRRLTCRALEIKRNIMEGKSSEFMEDDQGVMWYKGRICVPNVKELNDKILCEAHNSIYYVHPGGNKAYQDLKATYYWYGMMKDVAE
jgi:hypothetical protein